jgi:hypothetical protein
VQIDLVEPEKERPPVVAEDDLRHADDPLDVMPKTLERSCRRSARRYDDDLRIERPRSVNIRRREHQWSMRSIVIADSPAAIVISAGLNFFYLHARLTAGSLPPNAPVHPMP